MAIDTRKGSPMKDGLTKGSLMKSGLTKNSFKIDKKDETGNSLTLRELGGFVLSNMRYVLSNMRECVSYMRELCEKPIESLA